MSSNVLMLLVMPANLRLRVDAVAGFRLLFPRHSFE